LPEFPKERVMISPYTNLISYAGNIDLIKTRSQFLSACNIRRLAKMRDFFSKDENLSRGFGNALIALISRNPLGLDTFIEYASKLAEGDRSRVPYYFNHIISENMGSSKGRSVRNTGSGDLCERAALCGEGEGFDPALQTALNERLRMVKERVESLRLSDTEQKSREFLERGFSLISRSEPDSMAVFSLLS
jgi:hypothetical protein